MALFRISLLVAVALPALAGHRYRLDVAADPVRDTLGGTLRLTWRNDSGRALAELPLRGAAAIRRVADVNGREIPLKESCLLLASPLEPGRETTLVIEFESPFPIGADGYRLATGSWHPKALTFRKAGFDYGQEQADDYDVRIVCPAGEVMAVAGKRTEETLPDGKRRIRAVLENATSFGAAMSKEFTETVRTAAGVEIRSYRLDGGTWGPKLAGIAADVVPFYSQLAGFYPHPSLVILPGGMHSRGGYPVATAMVAIHNLEGTEPTFPTWILAHEIGHQFWGYDTVIDDGNYYHWPGLAMGLWMDRQYMEARGLGRKRHDSFLYNNYLPALYDGYDTTLRRTWPEINKLGFDFNNAVAHGKSYSVIQMLEELMGAQKFRQFALALLKDYRYRFLSQEDYEKAAAAAHGEPLNWFFRDWLDTNRKLGYEIAGVDYDGRRATVRVRQTGDTALPVPLEVMTADGRSHGFQLARGRAEQVFSFDTAAKPVAATVDPERRFPLYSPEARHLWGKRAEVSAVRWPDAFAWGTNQAGIEMRNTDDRPHAVTVHIQASTPAGGWGWDTEHLLEPGETKRVDRDFNLKPYPGGYKVRLQVRDKDTGLLLKILTASGEFKPGNDRVAPLRLPAWSRDSAKEKRDRFPRLRLVAGSNVCLYYLEGDAWLERHAPELLAARERDYKAVRERINPSFDRKLTLLLFPDAESKEAWTGHAGKGWATGDMLVEIRNESENVDSRHELVHAMMEPFGELPAVLNEGLAVYLQEGQRWEGHHVDSWSKAFASAGLLWPVTRIVMLDEIGPERTEPPITYPQAGSIVKFLVDRVGFEGFLAFCRALADPKVSGSMEASLALFQKHFGLDLAGLEREWRASLAVSTAPPLPEEALRRVRQELKK